MKKSKGRVCPCDLCRLSSVIQCIEKKCTPQERLALDTVWSRMEAAETALEMQKIKGKKL